MNNNYKIIEYTTFINFKNNCYFNVILQILINNFDLKSILMNDLTFLQKRKFKINDIESINNIYSPKSILEKLDAFLNSSLKSSNNSNKFNSKQQNDCIESLEYLSDMYKTLEDKIYGETVTNFKCLECKEKRFNSEKFLSISVFHSNIKDSFKELLSSSEIDLDCEYCKKRTKTLKSTIFKKIGKILLLHNILKTELILNNSITFNNKKYKLTGMVKHIGNQNGGHYYYIDVINKLIFNDCEIEYIKENSIDNKNIYLVVYSLEN